MADLPIINQLQRSGTLAPVAVGGKGKVAYAPGGMGTAFQARQTNFRPAYNHLNVLHPISVHQRGFVTFKMRQIHLRPELRQTHAGELHTYGWDLGQGGTAVGRTNV